ncbi:MAG: AraC family transcriptional regulator [Methylococcales bacterium]|nr:AraC family transcriptional regulator [Methylococcales bacterium]
MLTQLSFVAAGFSIVGLVLLGLQTRSESPMATRFALAMLTNLLALQVIHLALLSQTWHVSGILTLVYVSLLGSVGPLFFGYCQAVISPSDVQKLSALAPAMVILGVAVVAAIYPPFLQWAYALMFVLCGLYMGKLASLLLKLKHRRSLFKLEFMLVAGFLAWAMMVVALGVAGSLSLLQLLPIQMILLGITVAIALHIQLNYPHLLSSLEEMASRQYQTSTLAQVDCEQKIQQLKQLMHQQKIYEDSHLSLDGLAELLALKPHQLTELVNTQLDMNVSTYLRQVRVQASEALLLEEPKVSVLAIGLSVGFNSQSAFYAAFKAQHNMAPGQFRKKTT